MLHAKRIIGCCWLAVVACKHHTRTQPMKRKQEAALSSSKHTHLTKPHTLIQALCTARTSQEIATETVIEKGTGT